jgi:Flp pilus assembly protein TadB
MKNKSIKNDLKMLKIMEKKADIEERIWYFQKELKEVEEEKQEYLKFLKKHFKEEKIQELMNNFEN